MPPSEILSFEEIARVVRVGAGIGIRRVRLTGGEPLVRRNLPELVRQLSSIEGLQEISLTTNGLLLDSQAVELAAAGLKRVNISLDTLLPGRFAEITGGGRLEQALAGLESALSAGLRPVKINVVLQSPKGDGRGSEEELRRFVDLARSRPVEVRFIELMPFAPGRDSFVPISWVKERIGDRLAPAVSEGDGPAQVFRIEGTEGRLGFIAAISEPFCGACNRLRLSATGRLRVCLFAQGELDLRPLLRSGGADAELEVLFRAAVAAKPAHYPKQEGFGLAGTMCQIGG